MSINICNAIKERNIIEFYYDGGARVVEPYCYGESSKGNLLLRGYQIDGYSLSGDSEGWKLFSISKIEKITLTGQKFYDIRKDYNPNDKAMANIICNI